MSDLSYIATVVIPTKDRENETNRAIESVLHQKDSDKVQIIIVDDCSNKNISYKGLREFDIVIKNPTNMGAPVSRNIGIKAANSELIYLLDSDDFFIERNFLDDYQKYKGTINLYYTDIMRDGIRWNYPDSIEFNNYFIPIILNNSLVKIDYDYLGQSSSLMFTKNNIQLFDETLPKHQDIDLVLRFLLNKNGKMIKTSGLICFVATKNSLSRSYAPEKSSPFIRKIEPIEQISAIEKMMFKYPRQGHSLGLYSWKEWVYDSIQLLKNHVSIIKIIKSFIKRVLVCCRIYPFITKHKTDIY